MWKCEFEIFSLLVVILFCPISLYFHWIWRFEWMIIGINRALVENMYSTSTWILLCIFHANTAGRMSASWLVMVKWFVVLSVLFQFSLYSILSMNIIIQLFCNSVQLKFTLLHIVHIGASVILEFSLFIFEEIRQNLIKEIKLKNFENVFEKLEPNFISWLYSKQISKLRAKLIIASCNRRHLDLSSYHDSAVQ